ncbi:MAG: endonuclease/exonuclease/phosphatase family protein [bacterium]
MIGVLLLLLLPFLALVVLYIRASGGKYKRSELESGFARNYPEFSKTKSRNGRNITVMTYNIGYASGMKNNKGSVLSRAEILNNLDSIARAARKNEVDILAVQEIDFRSKRSHYIDQVDYLARKLEFPYTARIVNWDKRYVPFPPTLSFGKHFGRMESGQAVLSRFPIVENRAYYFRKPDFPFFVKAFYLDRAAQYARIELRPGDTIDLYNVHLEAFDDKTRWAQAEELLKIMGGNGFERGFVLGDFNAIPPLARVKRFPGTPPIDMTNDITIETIQRWNGIGEVIPPEAYSTEEWRTWTFPSDGPNRRLDYIFFSDGISLVRGFVDREAGKGSDHLPVVAEFSF